MDHAPATARERMQAIWRDAGSLEAPIAFDLALIGLWIVGQLADVGALSASPWRSPP